MRLSRILTEPPQGPVQINWDSPQAQGLSAWAHQGDFGLSSYEDPFGNVCTPTAVSQWDYDPEMGWGNTCVSASSQKQTIGYSAASTATISGCARVRFTAGGNSNFPGVISGVGNMGFILRQPGGALGYVWENTSDEYSAASGLSPVDGVFYTVANVVTPTAATLYMAGNGSLLSFTNTKTHTAKTDSSFLLGNDRSVGSHFVDAFVSDGRIYHGIALTESDIWAMHDPATRWDLWWQPTRKMYSWGQPQAAGGATFQSAWARNANTVISLGAGRA